MKVWITCFVLLFGAAELLQWIQKFSLPLPVFILGGVFLAVISNYEKLKDLPFHPEYEDPELPTRQTQPIQDSQSPTVAPSTTQPGKVISFTIRKPFQPGDVRREG
jgi:hypothetical protein